MTISNLQKSADLTNSIFSKLNHEKCTYKNLPLLWSIYSVIHFKYSLPLTNGTSYKNLLESLKRSRKIDLFHFFTLDLLKILVTCVSIIWLVLNRKKKVGLYSGDFYSEENDGDFRLGSLYQSFKNEKIQYVEFIRDSEFGLKATILNMFRRRRPVIYYSPIIRFCRIFTKSKKVEAKFTISDKDMAIIQAASYQTSNKFQINIFRLIYRLLKIKTFIAWEFMERQASLVYAANLEEIEVIGFMHGAGMNSYMPHEFMTSMNKTPEFGIDCYGVWSDWWHKYYKKNSFFYKKYEVISPLKEKRGFRSSLNDLSNVRKKNYLLWVCEPLISPVEIIEYIDVANTYYDIVFKIRKGANNSFYNELIALRPDLKFNKTTDKDMFEAIAESKLVIGSHSTGVLDACLLNTPFLLVNTKKWGNYFEMPSQFFCHSKSDFESKLKNLPNQNLYTESLKWFGDGKNLGIDFILKKIKKKTT